MADQEIGANTGIGVSNVVQHNLVYPSSFKASISFLTTKHTGRSDDPARTERDQSTRRGTFFHLFSVGSYFFPIFLFYFSYSSVFFFFCRLDYPLLSVRSFFLLLRSFSRTPPFRYRRSRVIDISPRPETLYATSCCSVIAVTSLATHLAPVNITRYPPQPPLSFVPRSRSFFPWKFHRRVSAPWSRSGNAISMVELRGTGRRARCAVGYPRLLGVSTEADTSKSERLQGLEGCSCFTLRRECSVRKRTN